MPGSLGLGLGLTDLGKSSNSGPSYVPQAVTIEGDTSAVVAAALNATTSPLGSLSFWLNMIGNDGVTNNILIDFSSRFQLQRSGANQVALSVSDGTNTLIFGTTSTIVAGLSSAQMTHIAMSWDTNHAAGSKIVQVYRNGVLDQTIISDAGAAFNVNYTVAQYSVGAHNNPVGASPFMGDLKELMVWPGVFIDWSNPANMAKVYSGGNPVDPGATGSLVTGTAPRLYHTVKPADTLATSFLTNRGTGSNLGIQTGALVLEKRAIIGYGDSHMFGTGASTLQNSFMSKTCRGLSPPWHQINFGVGGETADAIMARFLAAVASEVANYPNPIFILEGGYNNETSPNETVNDHTTMVNALLAISPSAKFLGIGVWNGGDTLTERFGQANYNNFLTMQTGLSALYGSRFIDAWRYFVNKSVSTTTSQAFIDSGLTPTAQDLTDLGSDYTPSSFKSGSSIHLVDVGHNLLATKLIIPKIQSLGWG